MYKSVLSKTVINIRTSLSTLFAVFYEANPCFKGRLEYFKGLELSMFVPVYIILFTNKLQWLSVLIPLIIAFLFSKHTIAL